ncbi:Venom carboxylesterase-6 [Orchesella cincta]|uniref:Carboxylic ester hydrolase n=1 Tax=Orchesella cincta TaxID=48709 RepID=A0A1D2N3W0_ORCCI|nr:Venom carboxylesterase-6 [Orchesella cincta]
MASVKSYMIRLILILLTVVHNSKSDGASNPGWDGSKDSNDKQDPVLVSTSQGQVEGMTLISRLGAEYYGFKGIPYAKVTLRFASPEKPDNWQGVFHANETASPCFHFSVTDQRYVGIEECLTLDIYTPKLDGRLPVAFWIHPGGFQIGTGAAFEGKYFADASVVLVTINYRLGAFGFLNTEDGQVLGNMGLFTASTNYDYTRIHRPKNVRNFGGDPTKVLLFGDSSGGASVHYHMLSSRSTGLFATGYSHSGSVLNPWAFQRNSRKNALLLAEYAGCGESKARTSLLDVECLRTKTAKELAQAQLKLKILPYQFDVLNMVFCPSVETTPDNDSFLSDSPYNIIANNEVKNRVPWLVSVAKEEGLFWTTPFLDNKRLTQKINEEWDLVAPKVFLYDDERLSEPEKVAKSQKIKEFYLKDKEINSTTRKEVSDIYADRFFLNGVLESIRLHQQNPSPDSPIYTGMLSYPGIHSITQSFFMAKKFYGTTHSDILQYLFNQTSGSPEYEAGTPIGTFSAKLIQLIVSFARNGKPTATWGPQLEWEPVTELQNLKWYEFNKETKLTDNPFDERFNFWKSLKLSENVSKERIVPERTITDDMKHTEM